MMPTELCANGIDDDMDGAIDCMDTKCAASAVCGKLVINEVDYDQLVVGDTNEFIEIYNAGTTDVDLNGLELDLINGANNAIYTPTTALTGTLAAGQYLVLATATLTGIDPAAMVIVLPKAGDNIQNGAPDAILLRDTIDQVAIDAISYEGAMPPVMIAGVAYTLVSGTATTATDLGTVDPRSIIRYPNGADTNDDSIDWRATTLVTPGAANKVVVEVCLDGMMIDEDADGLVDCADPDCAMFPGCVPAEICNNNVDDDLDMMIDCADTDCDMKSCGMNGVTCAMGMCVCPGGTMEMTCGDMMDNDCDGKIDCNDPDCSGKPGCNVEICNNGLDEDGDMLIDCADPDCNLQACGTNGLTCSMNVCVCPGGTTEMTCNDMMDNDCDGKIDCNDTDCTGKPVCTAEICDNNIDDDGDMMIDCADADCAMKACGMNGLMCAMNVCACPSGMTTEALCNDMLDEDCDGLTDCADPDCSMNAACSSITVTAVDYPVIAQGGTLVITGMGFMGATGVKIGGTNEMFTVDSPTQITVTPVDDTTPIAMQNIVVTGPLGNSTPFGVTVIRLQINELDADTNPNPDAAEFIEVSTGVPNVNLTGYTLVFWNGNGDVSYRAVHLNKSADANGLLFAGNTGTMPPSMITWPNDTLQNGADAVAIHQSLPAAYPTGSAVAAATRIIDALVYDTADADDPGLLDAFLGTGMDPKRVQVDETTLHPVSIQRCADGRRDGRRFVTGVPTMGTANSVAACP
jgi:hypothetical protein